MDYQLGPGPLQVDQNTTDEKIKGDIGIVENGDIATHAILKDYYVIWKGNLYKAKTDISSGTTLSAESNGNLESKSNGLGGEVAALNSKFKQKIVTGTSNNSGALSLGLIPTKTFILGIKMNNSDNLENQGYVAFNGNWFLQTTNNTAVNITVLYFEL